MSEIGAVPGLPGPVIAAPMAGGATTPELVAAVCAAGGSGFLAAGYKNADAVAGQIARVRSLGAGFFGVNVFVPGRERADPAAVAAYRERLLPEARRLGVEPGEPREDDDAWQAKIDLLLADPVPLVSFTFGCPPPGVLAALRAAGTATAVTVTSADEARAAEAAGTGLLVVQGAEAGAHQGSFSDGGPEPLPLARLLGEVRAAVRLPLVAAGGIMTGRQIAAVLAAGACAAQLGTAFLRCPEAGTGETHRAALADPRFTETALTRAFTGRRARGLVNRFMAEHTAHAPSAYPQLHHLTAPLRRAAAAQSDPDALHLWAGTGHRLIRTLPAADLVATLHTELHAA